MASIPSTESRVPRQSTSTPVNTTRITHSQSAAPHKNTRERRHEASRRHNQDMEDEIHVTSIQDNSSNSYTTQPTLATPQAKTNANNETLALLVAQQQEFKT
ncbi:uncharacterized protein K452DRAFT_150132 [Aplosporella prunicola CBS 121167]|uniref:Uncharacterized protein n=1 Tax=Aplosporella prunicola CBS 121167 TaxID=1176127 RepID=A0A6A6AYC1_9PEZI|nr:uncharacterized protein K452DRAFT_150132 [Aplosporella prunicola CBS 121167]KAF2135965.1 hypothetical protein K452DRAFT_150132 [Aplosporella prunicola CBS 121167]